MQRLTSAREPGRGRKETRGANNEEGSGQTAPANQGAGADGVGEGSNEKPGVGKREDGAISRGDAGCRVIYHNLPGQHLLSVVGVFADTNEVELLSTSGLGTVLSYARLFKVSCRLLSAECFG